MTFQGKPPVWRVGDFIAFGSGAVFCIGFLVYGLVVGFHGDSSAVRQAPWLLLATALAFLFVYWRVIVIRQNDIRGFVLVGDPRYGFMVNFGEYSIDPTTIPTLLKLIEDARMRWGDAAAKGDPADSQFTPQAVDSALTSDYIWVWFRPGDLDLPWGPPGKVAGYTVGRKMVVGFKPGAPPERTAFEHELGHVIQYAVTGIMDNDIHHARSKRLGIP